MRSMSIGTSSNSCQKYCVPRAELAYSIIVLSHLQYNNCKVMMNRRHPRQQNAPSSSSWWNSTERSSSVQSSSTSPLSTATATMSMFMIWTLIGIVIVINVSFQSSLTLTSTSTRIGNRIYPIDFSFGDYGESGREGKLLIPTSTSSSFSSLSSTTNITKSSSFIPYYMMGKTRYQNQPFHRKRTFQSILEERPHPIRPRQQQTNDDDEHRVWVLPDPLLTPTRNHESIILEYDDGGGQQELQHQHQVLVNVLGRYSRVVQWTDLHTRKQRQVQTNGTDPDNRPLNDLNHVASVIVDSIIVVDDDITLSSPSSTTRNITRNITWKTTTSKEIWLPCGFHNDKVGIEQSSTYVRIVDLETMMIRPGPKLPYAGGACGAITLDAVPNEPPLICALGGTDGNHDTGTFLPYISCFDRLRSRWVYPLANLPVGMDHLSVAVIPTGTCKNNEPGRILVFNYRTQAYSTQRHAEILAYDLPPNGWTVEQLDSSSALEDDREGTNLRGNGWYVWANHTFDGPEDTVNAPRDASGVVLANGGRSIVNIGGVNYIRNPDWKKGQKNNNKNQQKRKKGNRGGPKTLATWYSTVRELDVCHTRSWKKVADLGVETFALMAAASTGLNAAFFCGGAQYSQDFHGSTPWCFAIQVPGIQFWNHRTSATRNFDPTFVPGGGVNPVVDGLDSASVPTKIAR
jgi:hypothetical protein